MYTLGFLLIYISNAGTNFSLVKWIVSYTCGWWEVLMRPPLLEWMWYENSARSAVGCFWCRAQSWRASSVSTCILPLHRVPCTLTQSQGQLVLLPGCCCVQLRVSLSCKVLVQVSEQDWTVSRCRGSSKTGYLFYYLFANNTYMLSIYVLIL